MDTEGTCTFKPVCNFGLRSSKFRIWGSPFTLTFLFSHSLFSSSLLLLFFLFRISVEVDIRLSLPWVHTRDGATHLQNFPDSIHLKFAESSCIIAWDGNIHVVQRNICATQRFSGRQVNIRNLYERLMVSSGISNHQKT